jgi:hypothetical protein
MKVGSSEFYREFQLFSSECFERSVTGCKLHLSCKLHGKKCNRLYLSPSNIGDRLVGTCLGGTEESVPYFLVNFHIK